jgi:uncharacterized protein YunC (DUF1805 family)
MTAEQVIINGKKFEGHVIPIGQVNLVFARAENGLVGCGAIDVIALEKFQIPAAKVRPVSAPSVSTISDLLAGEIVAVNQFAQAKGITIGMNGKDALIRLS